MQKPERQVGEVQYGYAYLDDSETMVRIKDIDRAFCNHHTFRCPDCRGEMYATFGAVQVDHFRHNGGKCDYNNYLHTVSERVFMEEYLLCLEKGIPFIIDMMLPVVCNPVCVKFQQPCGKKYIHKKIDLTEKYTKVSLERRVEVSDERFRRPDILLESEDGEQLWVEIWVRHETSEE